MTYYKDLTIYSEHDRIFDNAKTIGWLDKHHPFESGSISSDLLKKLSILLKYPPRRSMGFHTCEFCGGSNQIIQVCYGTEIALGSYEIYVLFDKAIYISPSLIYHYIVKHHYKPPDIFLEALEKCNVMNVIKEVNLANRQKNSTPHPIP